MSHTNTLFFRVFGKGVSIRGFLCYAGDICVSVGAQYVEGYTQSKQSNREEDPWKGEVDIDDQKETVSQDVGVGCIQVDRLFNLLGF